MLWILQYTNQPGVAVLGSALTAFTMPVAFADTKSSNRKPIYDNDDSNVNIAPAPGSVEPFESGKQDDLKKSLTQIEEKNLGIQTELVGNVPVKTSKFLEDTIEKSRKWVATETEDAKKQVDGVFQKYLNVEKDVTSTVASLKSEHEDLLPGSIYILVAGLSGSVIARRHNFVVRALLPVALGVGAFGYFLPETFRNTRALVWSWEQKSPRLADAHTSVEKSTEDLVNGITNTWDRSQATLENGVHKTRDFIADTTGLQIGSSKK